MKHEFADSGLPRVRNLTEVFPNVPTSPPSPPISMLGMVSVGPWKLKFQTPARNIEIGGEGGDTKQTLLTMPSKQTSVKFRTLLTAPT